MPFLFWIFKKHFKGSRYGAPHHQAREPNQAPKKCRSRKLFPREVNRNKASALIMALTQVPRKFSAGIYFWDLYAPQV